MTNANIRYILAAGLIAEAASAAKLILLWRIARLTDFRFLTTEPVPAIVIVDIGFGLAFANDMPANFS